MISHNHKVIFVHIPKTGGSSIENLIWSSKRDRTEKNLWMGHISPHYNKYQTGGLQHLLATQIYQEVGKKIFNSFFKFTVVRNPWDKIISQFMYMKKRKDIRDFIGMKENDCLKMYLSLIKKCKHVQWEYQYRFFLDDNGEQIVNHIARFENFNDDVRDILEKINLHRAMFGLKQRRIPHVLKSKREPYQYYFDDESIEIVRDMYKIDIDLLNYEF